MTVQPKFPDRQPASTGTNADEFSTRLFEVMKRINKGIEDLELYEFRYALDNLIPEAGWDAVTLEGQADMERRIRSREFFTSIQLRPRAGERIVLDESIVRMNRMLLAGLVSGVYPEKWVQARFYFDLRGFYFVPRTVYFTDEVRAHFNNQPFRCFEAKQKRFEHAQEIGYKEFKESNAEIDRAFIDCVKQVIGARGSPMLITLAGPTAAGKTEVTERLMAAIQEMGRKVTSIEVDHFLLDREYRDDKPMGRESSHFELFLGSLNAILKGEKISIPRYDFVNATSSHDVNGRLKAGCVPLEIEPADIIFMEGNFPFHIPEISSLIGLKVVYLTDDPIRLKRKWKRDIDYRKKYDPAYFRNRYFRTQFLRGEDIYRPLMKICDLVVDTTGAALWVSPEIAGLLGKE